MEGISKINYKGKEILYLDYSFTGGSKEKIVQLISAGTDEYCKYPPKSALGLANMASFNFDKDVLDAMKALQDKCTPHQKKIALIGLKSVHKVAFNFIFALTIGNITKAFNTEEEAKEWLVKD